MAGWSFFRFEVRNVIDAKLGLKGLIRLDACCQAARVLALIGLAGLIIFGA